MKEKDEIINRRLVSSKFPSTPKIHLINEEIKYATMMKTSTQKFNTKEHFRIEK